MPSSSSSSSSSSSTKPPNPPEGGPDEELFTTNQMPRPASRLLVEKAKELIEKGQFAEAAKNLDRAVSLNPTADVLVLLGEARMKQRQPEKAIVPLAAAATFDPAGPGLSLLAETLMVLRKTEVAHEMAIRALARDSTDKRAREVFVATQKD